MTGSSPVSSSARLDRAVVIALGGNLPRPGRTVQDGLEAALERLTDVGLRPVSRSRWWTSQAWPNPADPPFLNGVVLVDTRHDPAATLALLHQIEAESGRRRSSPNTPRALDLDLIAHGRAVLSGDLVLPHPRAHQRLFVMGPLAEIAPAWIHPVSGLSALALSQSAQVGADAVPLS